MYGKTLAKDEKENERKRLMATIEYPGELHKVKKAVNSRCAKCGKKNKRCRCGE